MSIVYKKYLSILRVLIGHACLTRLSIWHWCSRKLAGAMSYIGYGNVQLPVSENDNGLNKKAIYLLWSKIPNRALKSCREICSTKYSGTRFLPSCSAIHRFLFPTSTMVHIGSSTHILKDRKETAKKEAKGVGHLFLKKGLLTCY